jgi:PPOX class probable F420-dependent enzyme
MPKVDRLSAGAVKLLKEPLLAHVATVMKDGSPQNTPMWVDVEDDGSYIWLNSAAGRIKSNNLDRDPRIAITVIANDNAWRFASIRGNVVEITTDGADAHIDALAKKYLGVDSYPFRKAEEQRLKFRVKPEFETGMGLE